MSNPPTMLMGPPQAPEGTHSARTRMVRTHRAASALRRSPPSPQRLGPTHPPRRPPAHVIFDSWVPLCRASCCWRTQFGAYGGKPRGRARSARQSTTTHAATVAPEPRDGCGGEADPRPRYGRSRSVRRSSTILRSPSYGESMIVRRRLHGDRLLQNSSDRSRPSAPPAIRMRPTVLMLKPLALTLTAKVRMAPTTSRKMLTPMLMAVPCRVAAVLLGYPGRRRGNAVWAMVRICRVRDLGLRAGSLVPQWFQRPGA